jgi:hypothetical protein
LKKGRCGDKDHSIKNTNPLLLDKEAGAEIKMHHKSCLLAVMLPAIVLS